MESSIMNNPGLTTYKYPLRASSAAIYFDNLPTCIITFHIPR